MPWYAKAVEQPAGLALEVEPPPICIHVWPAGFFLPPNIANWYRLRSLHANSPFYSLQAGHNGLLDIRILVLRGG
ncbi:UNVERIFIED_CONTAM: hypothetical protein K2H54_062074 [Gekko kuhli]